MGLDASGLWVVGRGGAQLNGSDLPPPPVHYFCYGSVAALCDGRLYVVGGGVNGEWSPQVSCFDPAAAKCAAVARSAWQRLAPMGSVRFDAAAASLNGVLYVAGGLSDAGKDLVTVERLARSAWREAPDGKRLTESA